MYFLPYQRGSHHLASTPSQFFDLGSDPYQLRNLVEQDPLPTPAAELDEFLRGWDAQTPWMPEI